MILHHFLQYNSHARKMGGLKTGCNGTLFIVGKISTSREGGGAQTLGR